MSSSTTTKTEIPDASPEEKALMTMMTDSMMPASLMEQGYDAKQTKTEYKDTEQAKRFSEQRHRATKEKHAAEKAAAESGGGGQRQARPYDGQQGVSPGNNGYGAGSNGEIARINARLDQIDADEQAAIAAYVPETSWTVRKMGGPASEAARTAAIAKYGDLPEDQLQKKDKSYKKAVETETKNKVDMAKQQDEMTRTYMEKTQKFLDGDFSITKEQQDLIKKNNAPIRASVDKMFAEATAAINETAKLAKQEVARSDNDMRLEVNKTKKTLLEATNDTFNRFNEEVKKTGMNIMDGLETTGNLIIQNGMGLEQALTHTISVNRELMKMGIEDYTGQVTKQIASSAASIGRAPDDPEYTAEMQGMVARKVQEGSLNLAGMEAQGMLAIKERTAAGIEGISNQKTAVAERTGGALESSALNRGQAISAIGERTGMANEQIAGRTASAREGIQAQLSASNEELIRARGTADVGLAESEANQAMQVGGGMAPQQVGLAQGVSAYNAGVAQQRIANASAAQYSAMPFVDYMQRERAYEPTTTQTTNPGIGGIFSGIIGAASAGAGIATGFGEVQAMKGWNQG